MTKTPEELTADWKEGKLPNKSIWWADLLNGKSVGRKAVPVRFRPSAPPYKPPLSAVL